MPDNFVRKGICHSMVKFDLLEEVAVFSLAQDEQPVLLVCKASNEGHARDRVLVEIGLGKEVNDFA